MKETKKIKANSPQPKMKAKDRYGKTIIYIRIDSELLELIAVLRKFYNYKTRNDLFPYLIILSILEVAAFTPSDDWSKEKKAAFLEAQKHASVFEKALVIKTAKTVLKKEPRSSKMTVKKLGKKVKEELT